MNRRTLLWSLAFAAGGGALWRYRDWLPVRGLINPCHAPRLPDEIAAHPAILRATQDLDLSKVWDCHVHLVGTGDSEPGDVWVNPALDSIRHPLQLVQKRLYMNASCVPSQQNGNAAYIDRLKALMEPKTGMRLLFLAFDHNYDEAGRRRPELSTFFISNRYAQAIAASHPRLEWMCSVHPCR
jgi:mannonate dehydratase